MFAALVIAGLCLVITSSGRRGVGVALVYRDSVKCACTPVDIGQYVGSSSIWLRNSSAVSRSRVRLPPAGWTRVDLPRRVGGHVRPADFDEQSVRYRR